MNDRITIDHALKALKIFRGNLTPEESDKLPGNAWQFAQIDLASWAAQNVETHSALLEALEDLLGDRSLESGNLVPGDDGEVHCAHCGRIYGDAGVDGAWCPSDDCPSFKARAAILKAKGETP